MKNIINLFLFITLSFLIINCSDDDDNPANSNTTITGIGSYTGTNSTGKPIKIELSDIGGKLWVTTIDIEFEQTFGGSTTSGQVREVDSQGIVEVVNNSFTYKIGIDDNELITGTRNETTITGNFVINFNGEDVEATYSASKQ